MFMAADGNTFLNNTYVNSSPYKSSTIRHIRLSKNDMQTIIMHAKIGRTNCINNLYISNHLYDKLKKLNINTNYIDITLDKQDLKEIVHYASKKHTEKRPIISDQVYDYLKNII
jgi:hypothetical protein